MSKTVGGATRDYQAKSGPRVRFAPSPTGVLHIGGARTALFNWLFARRNRGTFVLRIEDTDVGRSSSEMVDGILQGLRWLGLDWDEGPEVGGAHGPYFQSERLDRYRAAADRLVADRRAYYCYCTLERLRAEREAAAKQGSTWTYDRACLQLDPKRVAELERAGTPRAVRFRIPDGVTRFDDLVHGSIEVDAAHLDDFVILRSDRHPTFHLSVVCDDTDMAITHVIRGDDHISNTPKHVLLFRALGASVPQFAHVPLIMGPDKKRLSKRHGATSVMEYERQGYLPEAMVNFLALLGWSSGADREVFSLAELVEAFSIEDISLSNAVFNPEKLDWMNQQHIARLPGDDIVARIAPLLQREGLWSETFEESARPWLMNVIELIRPRAHRLGDFVAIGRPLFSRHLAASDYEERAVKKHLSDRSLAPHLAELCAAFRTITLFDEATLEMTLRDLAAARSLKAGTLIHAVRVAVTGRSASPGLFEVLALLGRERTLARLEQAERRLLTGQ